MEKVKEISRFRVYENFEEEQIRQEIIRVFCSCQGSRCHCFERLLEQIELFKQNEKESSPLFMLNRELTNQHASKLKSLTQSMS